MKALIEKNTWSGIEEYYRHMGESVWNCEYAWLVETWLPVSTGCVPKTTLQVLFLVLFLLKSMFYEC